MSRILFVMLHPGFIRYYEEALHALAAEGHRVHVVFESVRDKLDEGETARRLAASSPNVTCGRTPPRAESVRSFLARADRTAVRSGGDARREAGIRSPDVAWESLATTGRLLLDYLRFFEPTFTEATELRDRAAKRLPRFWERLARLAGARAPTRRAAAAALQAVESLIPASPAVEAFIREQRPDLLLVTPLVELGSQQVDYVKAARRLGVRSGLCVTSWDNLTSKGMIRVVPNHVVVWNESQKDEAVRLRGVAPEQVIITGAQLFDHWFEGHPRRSRQAFCRTVGLDPNRPFVVYLGSSTFIAPDEVPFVERWIRRLRADEDPALAGVGVLVRPHPANSRQWWVFEPRAFDNAALWPPIGTGPNAPDFRQDYFDSLYYGAAAVGINTSAQIEAGILGRPVFTIRSPEFAHAQAGTLHFRYLVNEDTGPVREAASLDAHAVQLGAALRGEGPGAGLERRFVGPFIRPHGLDTPVTPRFARAIGGLATLPAPSPVAAPTGAAVLRPGMFVLACLAHLLAEDRPFWVYAMRPWVTAAVRIAALGYRLREGVRAARTPMKRTRRAVRRAWHESWQRVRVRVRRTSKRVVGGVRVAGGEIKRAVRRSRGAA